jgi:nicotinate-nucleotide adenylyltransferase
MGRPDASFDLTALEPAVPGISGRVIALDSPHIYLSGKSIRQMVSADHSVRYLVPLAVSDYIHEKNLYRPLAE